MRRKWFQDTDGTYYRNVPLIMREQEEALRRPWRWLQLRKLDAEWAKAWTDGIIRTDRIGRRDRVVTMAPFRLAYPDEPALWVFDEPGWP